MSAQSKQKKHPAKATDKKWSRGKLLLAVGLVTATAISIYAYSQFFIFGQPAQLEALDIYTKMEDHLLIVDGSLATDSLVFAKAQPQQNGDQVVIQVNTALPSSVCRDRTRTFQCEIPLDGVQQVLVQGQQQTLIWSREGGVQP